MLRKGHETTPDQEAAHRSVFAVYQRRRRLRAPYLSVCFKTTPDIPRLAFKMRAKLIGFPQFGSDVRTSTGGWSGWNLSLASRESGPSALLAKSRYFGSITALVIREHCRYADKTLPKIRCRQMLTLLCSNLLSLRVISLTT